VHQYQRVTLHAHVKAMYFPSGAGCRISSD